jgi:hypothetical protein
MAPQCPECGCSFPGATTCPECGHRLVSASYRFVMLGVMVLIGVVLVALMIYLSEAGR